MKLFLLLQFTIVSIFAQGLEYHHLDVTKYSPEEHNVVDMFLNNPNGKLQGNISVNNFETCFVRNRSGKYFKHKNKTFVYCSKKDPNGGLSIYYKKIFAITNGEGNLITIRMGQEKFATMKDSEQAELAEASEPSQAADSRYVSEKSIFGQKSVQWESDSQSQSSATNQN